MHWITSLRIGVALLVVLTVSACGQDNTTPPPQVARGTVHAACDTNAGAGVTSINGERILIAGVDWDTPEVVGADDPRFPEFAMDDGEITLDTVLCTIMTESEPVRCEGYYSVEILDAVEAAGSLDAALPTLIASPNWFLYEIEIENGGSWFELSGFDIEATLVDLETNVGGASASLSQPPTCPDERPATPRFTIEPTYDDLVAIEKELADQ